MCGNNDSDDTVEVFSNSLTDLFDEQSLDLIINLLAGHYDNLKTKLSNADDYLEKSKIIGEIQLTESELLRFRQAKPLQTEIVSYSNNLSLDEFGL